MAKDLVSQDKEFLLGKNLGIVLFFIGVGIVLLSVVH